jgi:hypothetical protein
MRDLRVLKAAMAVQRLRDEQESGDAKQEVEMLRKASGIQQASQERETQAMTEV